MDNNIELLNYIYQNSQMGYTSISDLIDTVEDMEFKEILNSQYDEYLKINEEAKKLLIKSGKEEKEIGMFAKISSYIMIKINLMKDKSISHICEMMLQGSNMGIIDITKKINSYDDVEKENLKLAKRLLTLEEKNIEELQPFLKETKK